MVGISKIEAFSKIKQRLQQKLQVWKENLLSQGGKEVLLKAVALAIPTYAMSFFKLPNTLCANLDKPMAQFLWGQQGEEEIFIGLVEKGCICQNFMAAWAFER